MYGLTRESFNGFFLVKSLSGVYEKCKIKDLQFQVHTSTSIKDFTVFFLSCTLRPKQVGVIKTPVAPWAGRPPARTRPSPTRPSGPRLDTRGGTSLRLSPSCIIVVRRRV